MITIAKGSNEESKIPLLSENPAGDADHISVLETEILDNLYYMQGKTTNMATTNDWYMAVAYTFRGRMMKNWIETLQELHKQDKVVGYLSAEFLVGPRLGNALINLDILDDMKKATQRLGLDLKQLMNKEEEPGLGNGGLGRLAACFLDSMTTLGVPAIGYGIPY